MAEPSRRKRTGTTILSLVLMVIVSGRRSQQDSDDHAHHGVLTSIVSTLGAIPEVLDEISQFIAALKENR